MKIGVIGCGAVFEAFYLEALRDLSRQGLVKIALGVDSNPIYANEFIEYFPGSIVETDLEVALSKVKIDYALVLTPPVSHASIMQILANAGVHVYCEKPLTVSYEEASHIDDLFRTKGLLCRVGYVRRLFPNFQLFKDMYSRLSLGRSLTISDGEVFRWPIKTDGIFNPVSAGGGVVWDKLSHNLDMVQWFDGLVSIDYIDSSCRPGAVPVDVLVEGKTRNGKFKVAVSWTEVFPNMVRGSDNNFLIESKNGLLDYIKCSHHLLHAPVIPFYPKTYGEAVKGALLEFIKLKDNKENSFLASTEESIVLTNFLNKIDCYVRGVRL